MSEAGSETDAITPVSLSALLGRAGNQNEMLAATPAVPRPDLRAEARAEGFAEGLAEAEARLGARIAELEAQLTDAQNNHSVLEQQYRQLAEAALAAMDNALADALSELAHAAATAVLAHEPQTSQATLRSLMAELLPGQTRGQLFLAPADVEQARALLPEGWTISAREGLPAGTVEAEIGASMLRTSLQQRLQQLLLEGAS